MHRRCTGGLGRGDLSHPERAHLPRTALPCEGNLRGGRELLGELGLVHPEGDPGTCHDLPRRLAEHLQRRNLLYQEVPGTPSDPDRARTKVVVKADRRVSSRDRSTSQDRARRLRLARSSAQGNGNSVTPTSGVATCTIPAGLPASVYTTVTATLADPNFFPVTAKLFLRRQPDLDNHLALRAQ